MSARASGPNMEVCEAQTVGVKRIYIRCGNDVVVNTGEIATAHIVRDDENDIGSFVHFRSRGNLRLPLKLSEDSPDS